MERRTFLATMGAATAMAGLPLSAQANPETVRLTMLHNNDTHSRIEPLGPGNGAISG